MLRPTSDNVLVELETDETTTAAGLVLPSRGRRVTEGTWARVLRAGPGHYPAVRLDPKRAADPVDVSARAHTAFIPVHPDIKPGARVLLESAAATDYVDPSNHRLRVTREANIIMVEPPVGVAS